jgi:membrane-associated protease RseP (regulator of RpoE activity)
VAKEVAPEQESERGLGIKALAAFSTLTTILTTFAYALSSFALNPGFFNAVVNENDVTLVPICLPIFLGSIAMTALHELGHYAAARKYNITMGSPVPLPSFQVGSFGCITPFRSFPSSRTAMYDVAMSGPGLTLIISILLIIAGLSLTTTATSFSAYPLVPAAVMKSSFLLGSIASILAPKSMLVPLSQPIPVHPLLMIGLAGLIMSAVNLLPIGRLDGGRALMAAFGRRTASVISLLTLLTMAFCSFTGSSGVVIFWGALVVMTQRLPDIPAVDEVTAVNRLRSNCYIIFLMLGEFCFVTMI